jgi:hypothetical protein
MAQHRPKTHDTSELEPVAEEKQVDYRRVMRQITSRALKAAAIDGEMEIDEELHEIIQTLEERLAQIGRKAFIAWPEFPQLLIAYGKAFIAQGKRMKQLSSMPESGRWLRRSNSVEEWKRSLTGPER